MALSGMTEDKPSELAMTCLVRAAWCESINMAGLPNADSRFLLGLLSLSDAVMDRPMRDVLAELPVSASLSDGLIERSGPCGSALKMLEAYETGSWYVMVGLASELGASPDEVAAKYLNALGWAHRVFAHA
jgi:EAL and modified HD-GYP domain-containing signal transduction protein